MKRATQLEVEVRRLRELILDASCPTCDRLDSEHIEAHNLERGEGLAEAVLAAHHADCALWQEKCRIYELNAARVQQVRDETLRRGNCGGPPSVANRRHPDEAALRHGRAPGASTEASS